MEGLHGFDMISNCLAITSVHFFINKSLSKVLVAQQQQQAGENPGTPG